MAGKLASSGKESRARPLSARDSMPPPAQVMRARSRAYVYAPARTYGSRTNDGVQVPPCSGVRPPCSGVRPNPSVAEPNPSPGQPDDRATERGTRIPIKASRNFRPPDEVAPPL